MTRFKTTFAAATAAALMLTVTACGSATPAASPNAVSSDEAFGPQAAAVQELYQKAVDAGETSVTLYGPSAPKSLTDAFTARFPKIRVNSQNLQGADRLTKLSAEKSSGNHQGDVALDGDTPVAVLSDKGYCARYQPLVPLYPDADTLDSTVFQSDVAIFGIVYNSKLVAKEDVPKKWEDLLDPKWKGKITTVDPGAGGVSAFAFAQMLTPEVNNQRYGLPFLEKLKAQDIQFVSQDPQMVQRVASGQNPIAILVYSAYYQEVKQKGAPIEFAFPLERDNMTAHSLHCLLTDAPHPLAGQLYLNWILSREGQVEQTKNGSFSLLKGVPAPAGFESIENVKELEALPLKESITGYDAPIKQAIDLFNK